MKPSTDMSAVLNARVHGSAFRLLAGDQWDDSVQVALEQARYFILLVSVDSLNSSYCVTRELQIAVARGLPILPILLKPCPWEGQPAPDDPQGRILGAFGALPKDDTFALRPVSAWKSEAVAWNTVVNQLAERLLRDRGEPAIPASIAHPTATSAPDRDPGGRWVTTEHGHALYSAPRGRLAWPCPR
jgi:hypothetical protein